MNYTNARNYIDNCYKRGSIYGLDSVKALVDALGSPQNNQRIIHIAGTNGKGSVGAFLTSVLKEAGYKVGRFVSPSVYCYEERFQINDRYISKDSFAKVMTLAANAAAKISFIPTGFELETAAALCYFNIEKCDVSIIECGLGGENDATNVIDNNLLTVLTSISLDHTALLGDTITKIAQEKCGIIKEGCEAVSVCQLKEAETVITNRCREKSVCCHFIGDISNKRYSYPLQSFDYGEYKNIELSMLGDYQFENAALALECINVLKNKGINITDDSIYNGLKKAHWGGRFEVINTTPVVILDGAHNPDGAKRLVQSLNLYFKDKKMLFITGIFADKDYDSVLKQTAPMAEKIFAVKAPSPRGLDADILAGAIKKYNKNVVASDLKTALDYCLNCRDYVTVAFGSLSFIGRITEYINEFKEQ